MSKSKVILAVVGSLVLIAGLVAGMFLVFQNQNIKEKAAPATSLSITPSSQNKSAGESFNFAVEMDTAANHVIGIEVYINFDPQVFQVDSLTKGDAITNFNSEISKNIDNSTGRIHYTAAYIVDPPDPTKAVNGSNLSVLNVSARVKAGVSVGTYNFTFGSNSVVSSLGETQNVLVGTTPGSIVVAGATGQPTATPTVTPTGMPSGTATPTPLPTTSGQATATPTPTPTNNGLGGGSLSTPTSIPTPKSTQPPLPVSGISSLSIMGVVIGAFAVIGSLLLAL